MQQEPLITYLDTTVPTKLAGNTPIQTLDFTLLWSLFSQHRRLRVFAAKGVECAYCKKKRGVHLIKTVGVAGDVHIDVYTKDFELMTIDHIVAKSNGGGDDISNLIPTCAKCNFKKGDKDIKADIISVLDKGLIIYQGVDNEVFRYLQKHNNNRNLFIGLNPISPQANMSVQDWIELYEDSCAFKQWEQIGAETPDPACITLSNFIIP